MSFANFTNPYQNPADVPEAYRKHFHLSKLFKAEGSYVRPAEDPVTIWAIDLVKATGEMRSYVFSYKQGETDPEHLMVQVRDTL